MMNERRQRYDRGLRAEMIASLYLILKGYRILARRMKTPVGEIDLVARRGRTVVFIEVKARQTLDMGVESIRPRQSQRILRGAEYYMATYKGSNPDIRFDVIAISKPLRIRHIKSAFSRG